MDAPPSVFRTQLLATKGLEPEHTGTRFFSPFNYALALSTMPSDILTDAISGYL